MKLKGATPLAKLPGLHARSRSKKQPSREILLVGDLFN